MALSHSPQIVTDGLAFYYDMGNPQKSWQGAPTFNASLQNGQNDVSPWGGDGAPTSLGIDPIIKFRGRKVAKFQTGTSGNCYLNGTVDLSPSINSTVWTSTFYLKRVDSAVISTVGMYLYVTGNTNVNTTVTVTPVEDGWYKAVYTRSGLVSGYPTLTGMFSLGAATQYYFADWQCENLSISTPWVTGTRSNTESIIDLTNNNTVTANSLTYAADGSFGFNGSSNTITIPKPIISNTPYSVTQWIRAGVSLPDTTNSASRKTPLVGPGPVWNPGYWLTGRVFRVHANTEYRDVTINWVNDLTWHQIGQIFDGTTCFTVIDGQIILGTRIAYSPPTTTTILIGSEITAGNAQSWNGDIGVTQFYNRALSAQEVQQNFNALRGRYGI